MWCHIQVRTDKSCRIWTNTYQLRPCFAKSQFIHDSWQEQRQPVKNCPIHEKYDEHEQDMRWLEGVKDLGKRKRIQWGSSRTITGKTLFNQTVTPIETLLGLSISFTYFFSSCVSVNTCWGVAGTRKKDTNPIKIEKTPSWYLIIPCAQDEI